MHDIYSSTTYKLTVWKQSVTRTDTARNKTRYTVIGKNNNKTDQHLHKQQYLYNRAFL